MRTPASIAKHPIHPMLVPAPIGLWVFSLICDLIYMFGWGGEAFKIVAFYCIVGGVVGALLAAVPGLVDLLSLPAGPKRAAALHMSINLAIVGIYLINVGMRVANPEGLEAPVWLSVVAIALLGVSGWLGGKLVFEYGVAVDTDEGAPRT